MRATETTMRLACSNVTAAAFRILAIGAALLLPATPAGSQTHEPPPVTNVGQGVQILSPTDGVDFKPYVTHLLQTVRSKWFEKMPDEAKLGQKGKAVLRFKIDGHGTLVDQDVTLETSSQSKELDKAAVDSVVASAPFDPLPDAFHGPYLELRVLFLYNLPPSQNSLAK